MLADPLLTTLVLVSRPDRTALVVAATAAKELRELGIGNQMLVVNGLLIMPLAGDEVAAAYVAEQDLTLATQIQARLLPARDIRTTQWEAHYRYEPAGVVGGDYCEVIPARDGTGLFFALGDVTGKGVAASMLMAHLNAMFRTWVGWQLRRDMGRGSTVDRALEFPVAFARRGGCRTA